MKFVKMIWILLISGTLVNCASRSQVGAILGGASATVTCVELGISNPYLSATGGIIGAFAGVVHGVACQLPDGRWFEYE